MIRNSVAIIFEQTWKLNKLVDSMWLVIFETPIIGIMTPRSAG